VTRGDVLSHASAKPLAHLDVGERAAIGRAARARVPRSAHGEWSPGPTRADPGELLGDQEGSRLADLVPLRRERMLSSPFAFYRGAAAIMAADLATGPDSGLRVQACGDAHLENFGGFASPDRAMVFDVNDFDETNPGPFEWDVKRLAASFEIAARARDLTPKTARSLVLSTVRTYREAMGRFAEMSNLGVWYSRLDATTLVERFQEEMTPSEVKRFQSAVTKAQGKDSLKALGKLATFVDGEYRIRSDPPVLVPIRELYPTLEADQVLSLLQESFRAYRASLQPDRRHLLEAYRVVDFARKVVGVGSVGSRSWVALLIGKDDKDPLFLQVKEAEASVLEPYTEQSVYDHHGQRVVEGQRLLQAASDILLGWVRAIGIDGIERDFYVRQMWDWKVSADVETMVPKLLGLYAQMCGWTLARGHARSGDRVAIAAYLGSKDVFDRAMADFASAYADQNQHDYDSVVASGFTG
jgi:uncharacterized protein (DUF2252 family)